ncbi:ParB/RepB/Spo0J family partition protein [Leuconostoc mesenteroides]|uniref:ParB/RepB/Spo0J family partition protein n=1 Tax=Leuconostoc mesenteroides TaxID=1245 RepID=UPI001C1F28F2|nr:ParB/RepB/Spo0J family partition protein [Leuconostoc mesenteroides]MBU7546880.1 ParB/RepB/Spo0J family partition protein [Leuconostoc mesenteroides]
MELNLLQKIAASQFEKTGAVKKLPISNKNNGNYDVYKIPLDLLYYNDLNGRIATSFKQYIADNGKITPEPGDSQYNQVFQDLVYKSDEQALQETLASIKNKTQQEPGIVLKDGRIIDGNRRFTALRMYQQEDNIPKFFEAVVLDLSVQTDEKKIKELELEIQLGTEARVEYSPIERIFDRYNTIELKKQMTVEEYRNAAQLSKKTEVERDLNRAKLIIEFIKIVSPGGNPIDKFYLANELKLDGPIEEIDKALSDLKSKNKKLIEKAALVNLVISKTINFEKAPNLQMRDLKKNIITDSSNSDRLVNIYLDDDRLDDVMDAFEASPIKSANDLKVVVEQPSLRKTLEKLNESTTSLINRNKSATKRTAGLNSLQKFRDSLLQFTEDDFKTLNQDEYDDAIDCLQDIQKILFDLKKELKV